MRFTLYFILIMAYTSHSYANDWLEFGKSLFDELETKHPQTPSDLSTSDLNLGFAQALSQGIDLVTKQLGQEGGFLNDPNIHIPLPSSLQRVNDILSNVGFDGLTQELETKLNHAAEQATPHAKEVFLHAIKQLTFEDVWAIYQGDDDAATQYFQQATTPLLKEKMRPIIDDAIAQTGAMSLYEQTTAQYQTIPFAPNIQTNISDYALNKSLDGIFFYLAKEEAAIRNDPAKQTTNMLKKIFSAN